MIKLRDHSPRAMIGMMCSIQDVTSQPRSMTTDDLAVSWLNVMP